MDPELVNWKPLSSEGNAAALSSLRLAVESVKKAGNSLYSGDQVVRIESIAENDAYLCHVGNAPKRLIQLKLATDRRFGSHWTDNCDCGENKPEGICRHVYAALKALIAVTQQSEVEHLSSKGTAAGGNRDAKDAPPLTLRARAELKLGRQLEPKEIAFFDRFARLYKRFQHDGSLFVGDLVDLGIRVTGISWERLKLPAVPIKSDFDFWTLIAAYLAERKVAVPTWLESLSDIGPVRESIDRWRREQEVQNWQNFLKSSHMSEQPVSQAEQHLELRLRVTPTETFVEWRNAGTEKFIAIKPGKFHDFDARHAQLLSPEAGLLWQNFAHRARAGYAISLFYHDATTLDTFSRILRLPALTPLVVGDGGEPLERIAEPMRWQITPPSIPNGDYALRLVTAAGEPLKKVLAKIPGRPMLFLTAEAVYTGPSVPTLAFDPLAETRIPALALESRDGIRFLHQIQAPIPERLASRVQTVSLRPLVRAEMVVPYAGNEAEYCFIDLLAEGPDGGVRERWNGSHWQAATPATTGTPGAGNRPAGGGETVSEDGTFEMLDRSQLGDLPRLLESFGFRWDFTWHRWALRITRKFPEAFVPFLKSVPPTARVELRGELASFLTAEVSGEVRLDVQEAGIDWFDLKVLVKVSDVTLTPAEVKLLLDARGKWVRLGEKGWRKLEFKLSQEEDAELARLGLNPHELSSEPQRLHALQLADPAARRFLNEENFRQVQRRAQEIQTRVKPEIPSGVGASLRPYQLEGFHFLAYLSSNRFGGVLADDMGLGKTLQTLTWLAWLRDSAKPATVATEPPPDANPDAAMAIPVEAVVEAAPKPKAKRASKKRVADAAPDASLPSLVVCPKSVCDNWRAECERFVKGLRVKVWSAEDIKRMPKDLACADLHIINYAQLRIVGEDLARKEFLAVILDEGQYIKNPTSMTAVIARTLRSHHRLVLSGTPVENRLLDLWSLMSFAMPGALGGRSEFSRLYDTKGDPYARKRLAARVRPFLLRRTKSQVARDLPDRVEEDLYCEMEGEQKVLYRAELKRAQQVLLGIKTNSALNKERFNVLTSLLRLRQICCHPRLLLPDSKVPSAKLEALVETLEPLMEQGLKVLVFSQFVSALELIRTTLTEQGWHSFFLAGETEDRGDLVRRFQAHEGGTVFLISLKAGGFGLNLTSSNYVVLFDPWWNPAVENQAIDRTHRIGQTEKVFAYRLLIKDSIEEKIRNLQRSKSELADSVLGEERFAQALTLDDLRFLFSD